MITLAAYAAAVVVFLGSISQFYRGPSGFTALIHFGSDFYDRTLPSVRDTTHYTHVGIGYDGQFYAQLAVEPLLRDRALDDALDTPAYRARRILFAWTAYLAGLGDPSRIIKAYALQNIVAWLLLAWLMTRWLPPDRPRNLLPWVGCLFGTGLIASVRLALLEGPSVLLLAVAVAAVEAGRTGVGTGLMGLAGLGRETNLIAAGLLVREVPRSAAAVGQVALKLVMAAAPFVAWSLYVRSVYAEFAYNNPDSFSLPLQAILRKTVVTISELTEHGWNHYARFSLYALVGLTTQLLFLVTRREWQSPWWRLGIAYAALLVFVSPAVWDGYPGSAPRVVLPMTFAFNVLIVRSRWFWLLAVLGNLSVLHGLEVLGVPWLSELV